MKILILGGAGFLGKRLAETLLKNPYLAVNGHQKREITRLVLFDRTFTGISSSVPRLELVQGNIFDVTDMSSLMKTTFDVIFHLAAVVSGEAERDFDLGMKINLMANLHFFDLCRRQQPTTVLVFASTCAVFGGEVTSGTIRDHTATTPQSSYGTQKAITELLINDYSRRGFMNGRVLRLPTIVVRPGKPNAANSSFASSIIREPLCGQKTTCPVSDETKIWILSPKKVTENFIHAAKIPESAFGHNRIVTLPGFTTSVEEIKDRLDNLEGKKLTSLIDTKEDPEVQRMVDTWPVDFITDRANQLGFVKDNSIKEIIQLFIDEELRTKGTDSLE